MPESKPDDVVKSNFLDHRNITSHPLNFLPGIIILEEKHFSPNPKNMKPIVLLLFANFMVLAAHAQPALLTRTDDSGGSGTESMYVDELNAIETNTGTLLDALESPSTTLDLHALIDEVESQQNALTETSQQLQSITDEYNATIQHMADVLNTLHDTATSLLHQM